LAGKPESVVGDFTDGTYSIYASQTVILRSLNQ
jgi:hypothetical protein